MNRECPRCGAVYDGRRWIPQPDDRLKGGILSGEFERRLCPGCTRIEKKQVEGVVVLRGSFLRDHQGEIRNVINRVERNRSRRNVNSRILQMSENEGELVIETCDEHLAERIGKEIRKAFKGELEMKWQSKDMFVRVLWQRE